MYTLFKDHNQSAVNTRELNLPAGTYMFRVNNRTTRARCEICSKLKIKTLGRRQ